MKENDFLIRSLHLQRLYLSLRCNKLMSLIISQGKRLICSYLYMGIFYTHTLEYWRLPIRKLRLAFRGEVHQLVAAYMATAF